MAVSLPDRVVLYPSKSGFLHPDYLFQDNFTIFTAPPPLPANFQLKFSHKSRSISRIRPLLPSRSRCGRFPSPASLIGTLGSIGGTVGKLFSTNDKEGRKRG